MSVEFKLPDIGEGVAEGEIVKWFVEEGATIQEDAPLVSVLTDKANVEISSPRAGKILRLHAKVGDKVKVGGVLVTFEGGPAGGPASSAGGASAATTPAAAVASEAKGTSGPMAAPPDRILATPFVRRLAAERGIDLASVRGTGPGGRVVETDLGTAGTAATPPPRPKEVEASKPVTEGAPASPVAGEERIPLRGVRRVIAEHMSEATHRAAHYTYVEEVDASELVRWRDRMAPHVEKQGVRLSYLPFIIKAVTTGLKAHPWMNARMDDEHGELVVLSHYHIGIATATKEGLIVPVIRDADRKSVSQLARDIHSLSEKAREGKLQRSEITGGTFTITSLGALGGVLATPILNYPEVAILGVHKIQLRPVFREGAVVAANLMNLSVSLDHRVLDGAVGAQFMAVVKTHLEDPHQLFAETA